ncbi:bpX6 domain-containing protein [Streptomyces sp. NPDC002187]|uniref:bpX6 domain-containing protein n=1 Tax=Streptomyces sp. NPDC002187 TaxID=3364637 RepID=UPI0036CEF59D
MTTPSPPPAFRGRVEAHALVLFAALLGEAEARARVLELWLPGTTVYALPDGGDWLVLFGEPRSLRAEHALGLPVATAAAGGRIDLPRAGRTRTYDLRSLPVLDPADWLGLDGFARHALAPLEPPEPAPAAVVAPQRTAGPDLRAVAGVGEASARTARQSQETGSRGGTVAGRAPAGPVRDGLLVRLVRGTPAEALVRSRHERYLHRLTRQFESRRWDEALRDAVALGVGAGGGRTTLRLPGHRGGPLLPTAVRTPGGAVIPYGASVQQQLRMLYREAVTALEKEGRIEEAAFVLADLIDDAAEAVALLERHDRLRIAAELAEGRGLDAALVVRLWWRAGERARALDVARLRGAWAAAVDRLGQLDGDAARQLRAEWSAERYAAGDLLGAIEAAWPEPELRPGAVSLARRGLDGDAPNRAALLCYALSRQPDPAHLDEARTLLATPHPDEADWRAQRVLVRTLRDIVPEVPAVDRELSTSALRALLRGAPHETDPAERQRIVKALRRRADPLYVADLVPAPPPADRATLHLSAEREPGQLPLVDAVALSPGLLLTAHGDLGVRLLGRDGQVRARWDVPAHRLVVADHCGTALLVARRGEVHDIRRLDLATRRVRPWTTLRAKEVASSYDGSVLTVVDEDGIAFVATDADRPRALWRELERDQNVESIARGPGHLAAIVRTPGGFNLPDSREVWRWDLPEIVLRARDPVPPDGPPMALLSDGTALHVESEDGIGAELRLHAYGTRPTGSTPYAVPADTTGLLQDGSTLATVVADESRSSVWFAERPGGRTWACVTFPEGASPRLRVHAGLATLHDGQGRIVVLDLTHRSPALNLRTALR